MKTAKQVTYGIIGLVLLLSGILGLILPILPGIVLIFAGLILLSLELPRFDNYLSGLVSHSPSLEYYYKKSRNYIRLKLGYHL